MKKNGCLKIFLIVFSILVIILIYRKIQVRKHTEIIKKQDLELLKQNSQIEQKPIIDEKILSKNFEVIEVDTKENLRLKNVNALLKIKIRNEKEAKKICTEIRNHYVGYSCNINLFDDINALHKSFEYPLEDKDRRIVAKHFIAMSTFDAPKVVMMFPYK
ncbi:hypothetical protein [Chryseobacterium sp. SIMBA_029]|uniref:hypothetical protein n=1 Tax=Chryseobacterium sp. SIMBA_029 TaxID=3085772 RepID=UPI00397B3A6C